MSLAALLLLLAPRPDATVESPPAPPPPRVGKQRPVQPRSTLPALFSSDDYPAAALRAHEQGAVVFRLAIDKAGRITNCAIASSSGSASLDSTTCRVLVQRARFAPARDRKGRPTADSISGRILWRLPEQPEPPTPPSY